MTVMMNKQLPLFNRPLKKREWFALQESEGSAELMIYDEIGPWPLGAQELVGRVKALDAEEITLRINSPGGSVFDGFAIYNALRAHPARITAHIDGVAASIASILAMAGDRIHIAANGFIMIHDPWALVVGDAGELRHTADLLDKLAGALVQTYESRSTLSSEAVRSAMKEETWYSAEEAVSVGFADEITDNVTAEAKFDLSIYDRAPEAINSGAKMPEDLREFERFLRDAGFSRKDAKAIAGHGFGAICQRDADPGGTLEQQADLAAALYTKIRRLTS